MNHLGEFEGIGGFSLAAKWVGWKTIGWVEINQFCQTVLKHHFPEAQGFGDIKKFTYAVFKSILRNRGIRDRRVDIITGGFPCQPYSSAGLRKGTDDPRHLWPHMLRTIKEFRPRWVLGENVRGIINWSDGLVFEQVQSDLEAAGYEVFTFLLPACSVGAPHERYRTWFVAHRSDSRIEGLRPKWKDSVYRHWTASNPMPTQRERQIGGVESKSVAGCEFSITYANGQRLQEWVQSRGRGDKEKNGTPQGCSIDGVCSTSEFITHSKCEGLERGNRIQRSVQFEQGGKKTNSYPYCIRRIQDGSITESEQLTQRIPNWGQFPTQSPLCSRNDGVSTGLAGITFSRHRRESIQAYGNAIVPQVAYQIFKAINEYESGQTH